VSDVSLVTTYELDGDGYIASAITVHDGDQARVDAKHGSVRQWHSGACPGMDGNWYDAAGKHAWKLVDGAPQHLPRTTKSPPTEEEKKITALEARIAALEGGQ
jgi:hypothetical protein